MYASNANTRRNDTQTMAHPLVHYAHLATWLGGLKSMKNVNKWNVYR